MRRRLRAAGAADEGITLIELLVAMLVLSVVLSIVYGGFVTAMRTEQFTGNDSEALGELRTAADRFSKELREARRVYQTGSGTRQVKFWVDYDRDNQQDLVERITWQVRDLGTGQAQLVRFTDSDPSLITPVASRFLLTDSFFYDVPLTDPTPPSLVTLQLTVDNQTGSLGERTVRMDVRLRNAAKGCSNPSQCS